MTCVCQQAFICRQCRNLQPLKWPAKWMPLLSLALCLSWCFAFKPALADSVPQTMSFESAAKDTLNTHIRLDPIPPGDVAGDFSLPDGKEQMHRLKDYAGKYVIVTFWSSQCTHCLKDLASLAHAYTRLKAFNYEVLAIHAGSPPDEQFLKLNNFNFIVLYDWDLSMGQWGIPAIPTAYIVSPQRQRLYRAVGPREWSDPTMIQKLISITK